MKNSLRILNSSYDQTANRIDKILEKSVFKIFLLCLYVWVRLLLRYQMLYFSQRFSFVSIFIFTHWLMLKVFSTPKKTNDINSVLKVLHVIDDILSPLMANPATSSEINNPDAFQFLTYSDNLDIGGHRIRWVSICVLFMIFTRCPCCRLQSLFWSASTFSYQSRELYGILILLFLRVHRSYRQRVIANTKELVYQANGGFTFFIPVEEGFKVGQYSSLYHSCFSSI